jgi:DNA-binding NtrC family response regulator
MSQRAPSRILVVDDEKAVRVMVAAILADAGYEVDTAADATQAMCRLRSRSFDLVVSDVDMPGPNGHDLVRWVAANCPFVRCLLMSGFNSDCAQCPYATGCPLLRKPFRAADVLSYVGAALRA